MRHSLRPIVLMAAFAMAGCQSEQVPQVEDDVLSAVAQRDGVIVRLTIDHAEVETGTPLQAVAEIQNTGFDAVRWEAGGCELLAGFRLDGPEPAQPPPGQAWAETANLAKWSATTGGIFLSGFKPPNRAGDPGPMVCRLNRVEAELAAGASLRADATWVPTTTDGAPAPPGGYRASYAFPFLSRVGGVPFQADRVENARPITAALDVEVAGQAFAGIPSTIAIDHALADERVQTWVSTITQLELGGATILLRDEVWVFEIHTMSRGTARISVDPDDGRVLGAVIPP